MKYKIFITFYLSWSHCFSIISLFLIIFPLRMSAHRCPVYVYVAHSSGPSALIKRIQASCCVWCSGEGYLHLLLKIPKRELFVTTLLYEVHLYISLKQIITWFLFLLSLIFDLFFQEKEVAFLLPNVSLSTPFSVYSNSWLQVKREALWGHPPTHAHVWGALRCSEPWDEQWFQRLLKLWGAGCTWTGVSFILKDRELFFLKL